MDPPLLFGLAVLEDRAGRGSQDSLDLPHCCLPGPLQLWGAPALRSTGHSCQGLARRGFPGLPSLLSAGVPLGGPSAPGHSPHRWSEGGAAQWVRIPVLQLIQAVLANHCFQVLPAAQAFQGGLVVQEHRGDPAFQRRWGLLGRGRSTPLAHPSLPEVPFRLASPWLLEVQPVLAAHQGPEAQRHWHQEVPQVQWLLSPLEIPWYPSLQRGQGVPEVPEAPECQGIPGLQVPPGAPGLSFLEAQALPVRPSVLGALELLANRAGPVYQAGPRPQGPDLLWGQASQAVPPCQSTPPAG